MPEGPEIRRAADKLAAAVIDQPLTAVDFAFPQLKHYRQRLLGERIVAIEPRGKALLTHFSNGLTMYSHNQLYGVWKVAAAGETPETKRDLRVRLETARSAILLYSASDITVGPREEIEQHPFLQRIGPDVLDMSLTVDDVEERLLTPRFRRRQLGHAARPGVSCRIGQLSARRNPVAGRTGAAAQTAGSDARGAAPPGGGIAGGAAPFLPDARAGG